MLIDMGEIEIQEKKRKKKAKIYSLSILILSIACYKAYTYSLPENKETTYSDVFEAQIDGDHSFDKESKKIALSYSIGLKLKDVFKMPDERPKLKLKFFEALKETKGKVGDEETKILSNKMKEVLNQDNINYGNIKLNMVTITTSSDKK